MKHFYILLLVITILGAFMRVYKIQEQPPIMDEVQVAFSSENYMERGQFGPTMPNHPNLRNILVYASMKTIGTDAYGLRVFSLFLGMLGIPLLGLLVYRITDNVSASCFSAFFLAVDPVHITFSRQAIQEVHTAFFFLLGVYFVATGLRARFPSEVKDTINKKHILFIMPEVVFPLAGISFGLGLASKAHALFPMLVCFFYSVYVAIRLKESKGTLVLFLVSLTILPLTVYLLTYLPWFARGYGLFDWLFMQKSLMEMTATHTGNPMDSMIDLRPGLWFIKPFMGYGNFTHFEGKPFVTIAMGNPLVWMLVIPSTVYLFFKNVKGRWMLLVLFLVSYLPLVFSSRPIWVLSSIAVTPFAYGIVGVTVSEVANRLGRKALYVYVGLTLSVSILFYPMTNGRAWKFDYLRPFIERLNPHEQEILKGDLRNR